MVFQNYALYPHLCVYENIAFPLRLQQARDERDPSEGRRGGRDARANEHLDRKPSQLSGGQRQRVAMGRAIVREAEAFLFDEPLSNLDAKLRGQMRTEISRLQRRLGITTVYVTHDQTEAMTLGDRVAVLRKGVLQQVATPRELYEQPVNLFVAGFIGSPPMNFLPGHGRGRHRSSCPSPASSSAGGGRRASGATSCSSPASGPEHFEDAALLDEASAAEGVTFSAHVDVTEWLGNELYAYIPFEAPAEVADRLKSLAQELDSEAMRTQLVVALDAASRIKAGDEAELWFDPTKMHLFDPASGENLTRDLALTSA